MGFGPIVVPVLLLLGCYFLSRPWLRVLCGVGLAAWAVYLTVLSVIHQAWHILMFPLLVFVVWGWISEVKRSVG